jgi:3-phosphoglycerate kinase
MSPLQVPEGWAVMDIGTETIRAFEQALRGAHTVVWNGPLGKHQEEPFARGTYAMAEFLAELPARTIGAGGETAAVIRRAGVGSNFAHVSGGGGAALQLLAGLPLPGLDALPDAEA